MLGQGGSGTVYKGVRGGMGGLLAILCVNSSPQPAADIDSFGLHHGAHARRHVARAAGGRQDHGV